MPYRRRYRRRPFRRRRRRWRRRRRMNPRRRRNRTSTARMSPLIVSDQCYVKLRAIIRTTQGQLPFVTNVYGNGFNTSQLNDIDNLPIGLQRWSSFFQSYQILGSKITVSLINHEADGVQPRRMALYPYVQGSSSPAPGNAREAAELPYSRFSLYRGHEQSKGASIRNFMSTNKMFGQKSPWSRVSTETTGSFVFGSENIITPPDALWLWNIRIETPDNSLGAENPAPRQVYCFMTYYCRFFERRQINEQFYG